MGKSAQLNDEQTRRDKTYKIIILSVAVALVTFIAVSCNLGAFGYKTNEESIKLISVTLGDNNEFSQSEELNIFRNKKYNGENIIAPESNGNFVFCVSNISNREIYYSVKFTDEMEYKVNMRYRLKLNDEYVIGNEKQYATVDLLNLNDLKLSAGALNVFVLEWYWENDDVYDTIVGTKVDDQYYKLNLTVEATESVEI